MAMMLLVLGAEMKIQRGHKHTLKKDLFDLTKADLAEFEIVVSVFGTWRPETLHLHVDVIKHLTSLLSKTDKRLVIVGGAGSLYVDPEHKTQLVNTPDFPAEFYALAKAQTDALTELRKHDDVAWTFISPAADLQVDGNVRVNTSSLVKN